MNDLGRGLIGMGAILVLVGLVLVLGQRFNVPLGRLPGDIEIRGRNSVFYFPVVTCIVLSAVFSIVMWLFGRR